MQWPTRFLILSLLSTLAACQFMSQLPLIVKSPYLNTWVNAQSVPATTGVWPLHWNGHIVGWSSWIRVDGTSYQWTGTTVQNRPNMTANQVTPTRTMFSFAVADLVGFNVTYLSPIDPTDMVQQSLPFGYFYVDVWSLDGKSHSVQFYTDITGEILASNIDENLVQWNTTQSGNMVYHRMSLSAGSMHTMAENNDIASDSTLFLAAENRPGLSWQTGPADTPNTGLRALFNSGKPLENSADTNFRAISKDFPVLAFRVDLGNITQTNDSVVWSLGLMRDPVVEYISSTIQLRSSYYWSAYSSVDDIVKDVIGKFSDIRTKAVNLDNKVLSDGGTISSKYNDLISFALRLVFGAIDITILRDDITGALNTSDVKIFMKDLGVSSRVSPVETIYAALPALLYVNASMAGLVLEPLLEFQNSSIYNNPYAAPDLGMLYPKALGNSSDTTDLAIESCGNMLIMTFAHAMKSGDGSLIGRYYDLLKGWASYLEQNTLHPSGYENADGETFPNMSNLALKGIVGMFAMSKISEAAGIADDASHFQSQAQNYTTQWESLAISSGRITSVYGDPSSWGLIYNLYAAKLLGQDSISSQTYDQQSQYYASQVGTAPMFGFPYDTKDISKAKSHWGMLTAATATDTSVRDFIIQSVWSRAAFADGVAFPTTYDPNNGKSLGGTASPAQGAMFAQLALNVANQNISGVSVNSATSESSESSSKGKTNVGAIAGGVVGGLVGLLVIAGLVFFFRRRRRPQRVTPSPVLETREHAVYEPFSPQLVDSFQASNPVLPGVQPVIIASSKSGRTHAYYPSSPNTSSAGGMSFSPPSTTTTGTTSSRSRPSQDLRSEMEQLRREMEVLRTNRIQESEPPPLYDPGDNTNASGGENIAGTSAGASGSEGPLVPSRRKGAL